MKEKLNDFVNKNNGYLISAYAREEGFSRQYISYYARKNNLERVAEGIYITEDTWPDYLYISQLRNEEVVFSFETALYLHGLMDREPTFTSVSVNYGYNAMHLKKKGFKIHTSIADIYNIGIETVETQFGNVVKTYDMERTICDIIKYKKYMDIQVYTTALKEYTKSDNKRIPVLMDYARKLKIEDKVKDYFEVLL